MKIIRLDQNGKVVWQVLLDDDEMSNVVCAVTTGIVANALTPPLRTMADGIVDSLLSKTIQDDAQVREWMNRIRNSAAPGQFVVDATELARPHVKEEE